MEFGASGVSRACILSSYSLSALYPVGVPARGKRSDGTTGRLLPVYIVQAAKFMQQNKHAQVAPEPTGIQLLSNMLEVATQSFVAGCHGW